LFYFPTFNELLDLRSNSIYMLQSKLKRKTELPSEIPSERTLDLKTFEEYGLYFNLLISSKIFFLSISLEGK